MKDTWKFWVNDKYHYFRHYKIYRALREHIREGLEKGYGLGSDLLKAGFEPYQYKIVADRIVGEVIYGWKGMKWVTGTPQINCNWFGVSVYDPDWLWVRGNKSVLLSIGMATPTPTDEEINTEEYYKFRCGGGIAKYISFSIDDKIIYQDFYGNLPEQSFIENFLKP